ncbi:MAG: hypothetical protein HYR57_01270 [Candidatus Koribacter versatilis]|nr:hypothetical protein [Candidatus Koribacter versatilis]
MHPQKILRNCLAAVAFVMVLAASAVAQQYQILRADYGYGDRRVDVTQRLRELARQDTTFRMGNSTFGVDPAPGQVKVLRIWARGAGGETRTFEYREGSVVDGSMFSGWGSGNWGWDDADNGQYQILEARYGVIDSNVDVTQRLKELARQDITFRMGNSTFGVDPAPGRVKILRIYTRAPRGGHRIFEYREGSVVDGSMFNGWGRGDWGGGGWNGGWGDDEGQYQILQARYGVAENNVDVTPRLKELARQDRTFRMGNSTFGVDPAPGRVKTLRIYTRGPGGARRMFEYREGSVVDGSQFTGWGRGDWGHGGWDGGWGDGDDEGQYQILQARYGTAENNVDVTQRLKELARQDRTFRMGNSTFGVDPARGRVKTLRIYTRGPGGARRMFEYREGSVVDGSQFTGWGRGDWGHGGWNGGWGDGDRDDRGNDNWSDSGRGNQGRLNIVKATYGAGNRNQDVTERLRSLIREGRLDIAVDNDTLGTDPAPGSRKTLWVSYSAGGGSQQQTRVQEGGRVSIP